MVVRWFASSAGRCLLQPRQRVRSSTCDPAFCHGLNIPPVRFGGSVAAAKVTVEEHEKQHYEDSESVDNRGTTKSPLRPNDIAALTNVIPTPKPSTSFPIPLEAPSRRRERALDNRHGNSNLHETLSRLHQATDGGPPINSSGLLSVASEYVSKFTPLEVLRLLEAFGESVLDQEIQATIKSRINDGVLFSLPSLLIPRRSRQVSIDDVKKAEDAFHAALPALSHQPTQVKSRVICIYLNHMLYLASRIPSKPIFDRVRTLYGRYEIQPDSYTDLARLLLLDHDDHIGKLPGLWRELRNQKQKTVSIIHLNALLWAYVKRGQWDVVGPLYNKAVCDAASTAFSATAYFSSQPLPVPTGIHPSRATFQCVMRGLAHYGNLFPALLVLQDMTRAGKEPLVSDFIALFQGFARFGRLAADSQRTTSSQRMPPAETFPQTPVPTLITPQKSSARRLSDIWAESMKFGSDQPDSTPGQDEWNQDSLDALFNSLIGLPPPRSRMPASPWTRPRRDPPAPGPSPRAVFYVLMAFSRVKGDDPVVLLEVLNRLEAKFGPRNEEGWTGWRLDGRLTRLRQEWEGPRKQ